MQLAQQLGEVKASEQRETHAFGIADFSIVMDLLSKLYQYPKRTLVQEYLCNARDASREVGQNRRVQVWAPTSADPTFKVRDYGPGLSPDRMVNVFLQYGASTKRDDNSQTGGFGIGAKSAWAYTDSFVVESFHNGVRYAWVCYKDEEGGAVADLSAEEPTDEPNGVLVQIAVDSYDVQEFQDSIRRATMFWRDEEKPVVFGLPAMEFSPRREPIAPGCELWSEVPRFVSTGDKALVVVDGVPYPLGQLGSKVTGLSKLTSKVRGVLVWSVGTGEVLIAPTREGLKDTDGNREVLSSLVEAALDVVEAKRGAIYDGLTDINSILGAWRAAATVWADVKPATFGVYELSEQGQEKFLRMPKYFGENMYRRKYGRLFRYTECGGDYVREKCDRIPVEFINSDRLFYDDGTLTPLKMGARLRREADKNDVILVPVLQDGFHLQVAKDLGARPVSVLPEPPKTPRAPRDPSEPRERRAPTEVVVHVPNRSAGTNTPTTVYLTRDTKTYVYAEFGTSVDRDLQQYIENEDKVFCYVSQQQMPRVRRNKGKFITVEQFVESFETPADYVEAARYRLLARELPYGLRKWADDWRRFDDLALRAALRLVALGSKKGWDSEPTVPKALKAKLPPVIIGDQCQATWKRMSRYVGEHYPLLSRVDRSDLNKEALVELVEQVNGKHKKLFKGGQK
jgi:hypothetical protein